MPRTNAEDAGSVSGTIVTSFTGISRESIRDFFKGRLSEYSDPEASSLSEAVNVGTLAKDLTLTGFGIVGYAVSSNIQVVADVGGIAINLIRRIIELPFAPALSAPDVFNEAASQAATALQQGGILSFIFGLLQILAAVVVLFWIARRVI